MRATTKQKYIDAGRCANGCQRPLVEGKFYCANCVASQAASRYRRYHDAIRNGICPECQERPPKAGIRLCQECAAEQAKRCAERREERKAQGLCTVCGAAPLVTKNHCERCAANRRARQKQLRAKQAEGRPPKPQPKPKRAPRPVTTMVRRIDLEDVLFSTNSKSWGGMILRRVIARLSGKPVQGSVAAIWSAEWDAGRGLHWPDVAAVRERLEQGRNAA